MARPRQEGLTDREIELIQVLWQQKEATVEMIQAKLPDRLEGSTIRTLLQIMEDKGYVAHEKQGRANVYRPVIDQQWMAPAKFIGVSQQAYWDLNGFECDGFILQQFRHKMVIRTLHEYLGIIFYAVTGYI